MKTNPSTYHKPLGSHFWRCLTITTLGLLLTMTGDLSAAGKKDSGGNGGGKGKDSGGSTSPQYIDVQIWLDDEHSIETARPNGLVADEALAYTHDQERVSAQLGTGQHIYLSLNTHNKRPAIRHFLLNGGGFDFVDTGCIPEAVGTTDSIRPILVNSEIPEAWLHIMGPDFDDMALFEIRAVNARISFQDAAGQVWMLHYGTAPLCSWEFPDCMQYAPCGSDILVQRLPNKTDGKSQWQFATIPQEAGHLGYLYYLNPDRKAPNLLAGVINLSWSGVIETIDPHPAPVEPAAE